MERGLHTKFNFAVRAGKCTILRLLYLFYDLQPDSGRILIDGQDICTVTLSSLRRAIGQDPVLFNASIGYKIAYGQPSTRPADENTIVSSAQAAQMHDRIMNFPEGYETKDFLELNGLFASMWADQISASKDPKTPARYVLDIP
ncbi:hypothetical protein DFJ58DRAFT_734120 [Suillus subalutaceus]|uniref:uncharacterized protein n=1 Tax=Suillus subalutaceus TaxID=48586 RepID=UPI001B87556C|nr:uncharacterized protein DFJ58DRAFT_734120 [Suillus subalutaceus]KAG1837930.1 hypothetical protein DFJ58DRAFT_734120 [Suillus subalutaceus]